MSRGGATGRARLAASLVVTMVITSLTTALTSAYVTPPLHAQVLKTTSSEPPYAKSLDMWLVSRFRGAQLLADSGAVVHSMAAESALPRVEGTRDGRGADTLFALHIGARPSTPVLANAVNVQLAGPTGTITPLTARVIARRAFRAPRRPGAPNAVETAWRYGWSYLIVLPRGTRESPAARYRGWLLLSAADVKKP